MSALLFSAAAQCDRAGYCEASMGLGRRDRYFYHSSEDDDGDLVAVRLGPWKLHFLTKGSHCNDDFPDAECYAPPNDRRSVGGLLFNVERDMSEVLPLSNTSYEYVLPSFILVLLLHSFDSLFCVSLSLIVGGFFFFFNAIITFI